ncbi:MAG: phosphoribosylglycinamide formyltransferase [Actinomycetia bacterium]|nr:phosphoribosylglycinamide formyltransferase [Actinomycetes bacterium]
MTLKLGILISGNGSNLQAIIDAIAAGSLDAEIRVVISNKSEAYGLKRAEAAGIKTAVVRPADFAQGTASLEPSALYNDKLRRILQNAEVDWVVMAGYMKLLGPEVLDAFPNHVLNLHPALLPAFPGAHAIEEAYRARVPVTGVTVHIANERFDDGPILAQTEVPILPDDTLEVLEARIHAAEHRLLPQVLATLD